MTALWVALFGVLGVLARFGVGLLLPSGALPWGTAMVNGIGAFCAGVLAVLGSDRFMLPPEVRTGIAVGFLGGFTTFSSYCLESLRLWDQGFSLRAALYFVLSPPLGVSAALLGMILARRF